eukprot:1150023-Pelagomonas_calceolata.AAC.1
MPLLGLGPGDCPFWGLCSRTCGPFQLAAESTDLHNSNCNGIFYLCSNYGVSCCMNREVKARKFAHVMWSRICIPCPVMMRESLVYGLLLTA